MMGWRRFIGRDLCSWSNPFVIHHCV